jgi:hypothetical protein
MWPSPFGGWQPWPAPPPVAGGWQPFGQTFTTTFTPPTAPPLSDADVERIANRVVELLREAKS